MQRNQKKNHCALSECARNSRRAKKRGRERENVKIVWNNSNKSWTRDLSTIAFKWCFWLCLHTIWSRGMNENERESRKKIAFIQCCQSNITVVIVKQRWIKLCCHTIIAVFLISTKQLLYSEWKTEWRIKESDTQRGRLGELTLASEQKKNYTALHCCNSD